MITRIIKIRNSQGIRIPKILLDQSGIHDEVELEVKNKQLIIRQKRTIREGWDLAFKNMSDNNDDQLLDRDSLLRNSWDEKEWEW
jgi:antitoxin MazE